MKRLILLLLLAVSILGSQAIINCSKPFDPDRVTIDPDPDPNNQDTVFIFDTVFVIDTIITIDTIFGGDTIIVVDTFIVTDTIIAVDTIILTDTLTITDTVIIVDTLIISPTYCASLSSSQKTVTWMLQNHAGTYSLEFQASGDNNDPKEILLVEIDGVLHEWRPYDNPKMALELNLDESAIAVISAKSPHAFGHALDICLKVDKQ